MLLLLLLLKIFCDDDIVDREYELFFCGTSIVNNDKMLDIFYLNLEFNGLTSTFDGTLTTYLCEKIYENLYHVIVEIEEIKKQIETILEIEHFTHENLSAITNNLIINVKDLQNVFYQKIMIQMNEVNKYCGKLCNKQKFLMANHIFNIVHLHYQVLSTKFVCTYNNIIYHLNQTINNQCVDVHLLLSYIDEYKNACINAQRHVVKDLTMIIKPNYWNFECIKHKQTYMNSILFVVENNTNDLVKKQSNNIESINNSVYTCTPHHRNPYRNTSSVTYNKDFCNVNPTANLCNNNLNIIDYCKKQLTELLKIKNTAEDVLKNSDTDNAANFKFFTNSLNNLENYSTINNIEKIYQALSSENENRNLNIIIEKKNEFCIFLFTFLTGSLIIKQHILYAENEYFKHKFLTPPIVLYIKEFIIKIDILCCFIKSSIYMKDTNTQNKTYNNTNYYGPNHSNNIFIGNLIPQN